VNRRHGFTIIEMLAVTAIFALVAATLSVGLASVGRSSALRMATTEVNRFDRMARLLARSEGAITIAIDRDLETIFAHAPSGVILRTQGAESLGLGRREVDNASAFSLLGAAPEGSIRAIPALAPTLPGVQIDGAGRSIDFVYRVAPHDWTQHGAAVDPASGNSGAGGRGGGGVRIHVAGLTGELWEEWSE